MLFRLFLLTVLTNLFLLVGEARAINFASAYKPPSGYQLKLYPSFYSADTRTDKDGDPAVSDLELQRYGVAIGHFYQLGDWQLSALIPVSRLEIGRFREDDAGLGDVQLRAGRNTSVAGAEILSGLMLKLPTGSFDADRKVNVGDGQTDLAAELFFFKLRQPFSFDLLIKYNVRLRNPDTDVTPGNEFVAEGLLTCRIADRLRIGPAVNFIHGTDNRKGGRTLPGSGLMRLAAGGELFYGRFDTVKISLAAYRDLRTRNTNEGSLIMSRIAILF